MFLIKNRLADAQYLITNFMIVSYIKYRGSRLEMFFKIGVLKIFCNIRKKTPVLESLFNKSATGVFL